jgi:hypothetical protein
LIYLCIFYFYNCSLKAFHLFFARFFWNTCIRILGSLSCTK